MVNLPSFSLGAEFKPPMATQLSNSKGLDFPFAVNGFHDVGRRNYYCGCFCRNSYPRHGIIGYSGF